MLCLERLAVALLVGLAPAASLAAEPPVVVVIADNGGTETTDFLVPFGVLSRAGVADVRAVALRPGPVALHPALEVEVPDTIASFDARVPGGADFVIVPAVMNSEEPALLDWLRKQAALGATFVSICDGAFVLAHTGLLDGQPATAHWYSRETLAEDFPAVRWVRDRRYVDAGRVMTTTGVSASIPASLALVEKIAGPARAREVASSFGVAEWGPAHDSGAFALSAGRLGTGVANWLAFWRHERVGIPAENGVDEVSLGLVADALARTWRAEPVVLAPSAHVTTQHGLKITTGARPVDRVQALPSARHPEVSTLDSALASIESQYGEPTAAFVALQLEYRRP
jgi:putative intracellular protease/amidase